MGRSALGIVENIARTVRSLQREGILYLGLCPDNIVIQKQEQLPKVLKREATAMLAVANGVHTDAAQDHWTA